MNKKLFKDDYSSLISDVNNDEKIKENILCLSLELEKIKSTIHTLAQEDSYISDYRKEFHHVLSRLNNMEHLEKEIDSMKIGQDRLHEKITELKTDYQDLKSDVKNINSSIDDLKEMMRDKRKTDSDELIQITQNSSKLKTHSSDIQTLSNKLERIIWFTLSSLATSVGALIMVLIKFFINK